MGRIVVSENVSLDGVSEDPRGEEGLGRGDWFALVGEKDLHEWRETLVAEIRGAEAVLLGRRSYEYFVARYPSRSDAVADRLNSMPKYVVSSTLDQAGWTNSTVLSGDVVDEVARLKREVDGEIVVYASSRLVHALIEHDLVDELRLMTYPFVVGAGERVFGGTSGVKPMRLFGTRVVGENLVLLTYRTAPQT
jgi:dihydrofolate reductase